MTAAQLKKIVSFYGRFLLSFTNIGYRWRRLFWSDPTVDFTGQRWLVTGASGGLGAAIAMNACRHGAQLLAVARSADKLRRLRESAAGTGKIETAAVDLSLQADVQSFIDTLGRSGLRFDVVANNVGVLLDDHTLTTEGRETSFATNLLNHHLLTEGLIARDLLNRGAIVINMSSGGMYNVPLMVTPINVKTPKGYNGVAAYGFHKRAQVVLARHWNETHGRRGFTFYVMHPGWSDTDGVKRSLPRFRRILKSILRDADGGADTAIWLAAVRPAVPAHDHIWFDRKARPAHAFARTRQTPDSAATLVKFLDDELARVPARRHTGTDFAKGV